MKTMQVSQDMTIAAERLLDRLCPEEDPGAYEWAKELYDWSIKLTGQVIELRDQEHAKSMGWRKRLSISRDKLSISIQTCDARIMAMTDELFGH